MLVQLLGRVRALSVSSATLRKQSHVCVRKQRNIEKQKICSKQKLAVILFPHIEELRQHLKLMYVTNL